MNYQDLFDSSAELQQINQHHNELKDFFACDGNIYVPKDPFFDDGESSCKFTYNLENFMVDEEIQRENERSSQNSSLLPGLKNEGESTKITFKSNSIKQYGKAKPKTEPIEKTKLVKKEKKQKKNPNKKDEIRNLPPNAVKTTLKCISSEATEVFNEKIQRICKNLSQEIGVVSVDQFKRYCQGIKSMDFFLKDLYSIMNYNEGTEEQKTMKKIFHEFFSWFMKRRYSVYVLKSEQCEYKEKYLVGKNKLRYLPEIKEKVVKISNYNSSSSKV